MLLAPTREGLGWCQIPYNAQDSLHTTAEKSEFREIKLPFSGWNGTHTKICLTANRRCYHVQGSPGTVGIPKAHTVTV